MPKRRSAPRAPLMLTAVGLSAAVSACGTSADTAKSGESATTELRLGLNGSGTGSMNPALNSGGGEASMLLSLAYSPLIHQNSDGTFAPGLASSWRYVGAGNKVFELTLRDGAKFSDGTPVDAQSVKAWLDYSVKANTGGSATVGKIDSVQAPDAKTVRIKLKDPNPTMPHALSEAGGCFGLVAAPSAAKNPDVLKKSTEGAGPYVLDAGASVTGDHYVFTPNKNYYDQSAIHYKKITVRIIKSTTTMLQSVKTGQIDVAEGDSSTAQSARSSGLDVRGAVESTAGFAFLDLSGQLVKALADPRVRQALNYAVDRQKIATSLFPGNVVKPTDQFTTQDGYDPSLQNHYTYDPNKAKALLAQAGYPKGFTFTVLASAGLTPYETLARAVASDLAKVGVTVDVKTATSADLLNQLQGKKMSAAMFMQNNAWWLVYQYYFASGPSAIFNQHNFSDPDMNRLWQAGSKGSQSAPQWKQMTQRAVTQAYFLPVLGLTRIWYFHAKAINGITPTDKAANPWPATWSPKG
jgi:peptide/nickel transport system substrate-binding protein